MKLLLALVKTEQDIKQVTEQNNDKIVYGVTPSGSLYAVVGGTVSQHTASDVASETSLNVDQILQGVQEIASGIKEQVVIDDTANEQAVEENITEQETEVNTVELAEDIAEVISESLEEKYDQVQDHEERITRLEQNLSELKKELVKDTIEALRYKLSQG